MRWVRLRSLYVVESNDPKRLHKNPYLDRTPSSQADRNNEVIRRIAISTGVVTTLAGTPGVYGFQDGVGTAASFFISTGVAMDAAGSIALVVSSGMVISRHFRLSACVNFNWNSSFSPFL